MPSVDVTVSCPVFDSFRVQQIAGMFDVPLASRASEQFRVEMPELGDDWRIGLIVGPSGSGKSTIARKMFADRVYREGDWPRDRAVIDGLGEKPIKQITRLFTSVGFGSPPSWIKPYHVLSGGERFRCDLARALGSTGDGQVVVFDEFTSVVDRNVAKIGSAAVAKGIRRGQIGCRFVAVTCHYDVAEWLEPDWVIDMADGSFQRRRLRRPPIEIKLYRCRRSAWKMFARHHYLSSSLPRAVRCFIAVWKETAVAFCATASLIGRKNRRRISRVVTLPDFQGVGIGMAVVEAVADLHLAEGHRLNVTASHPSLIAHCRHSPRWRAVNYKKTGSATAHGFIKGYRGSAGRAVVSFEYIGPDAGQTRNPVRSP
jgi:energy-coupling factor transporter ATP-binding protein EcfA2